jgi:hypothetical protein
MCVPENEMETLKRSTNQLAQGTVFEVGETKSGGSEVTDLPNADPGIKLGAMSSLFDVNTQRYQTT